MMYQLRRLREANRARQKHWPGYENAGTLFRAVEFGEEAGELLGAVKKLTRELEGIAGNGDKSLEERRQAVREEAGDVLVCLDMLMDILDIDLDECVPMKFNKTSEKVGNPILMDSDWNHFHS